VGGVEAGGELQQRYASALALARAMDPRAVARGVDQAFFVSPVDPPSLPAIRDLDAAALRAVWRDLASDIRAGRAPELLSLYVHVPFCYRRCSYCIFSSREIGDGAAVDTYLDGLRQEVELLAPELAGLGFITRYLGGGTPTALAPEKLAALLELLDGAFSRRRGGQWAFECNPQSVSRERVALFAEHGYNHVNIGVQSLDAQVLERANRAYQTTALVERAVRLLLEMRFYTNVDLLHGLPGESDAGFEDGLRRVVALGPHRITIYGLSPATPLRFERACGLEQLAERSAAVPQAAGYRLTTLDSTCLEFSRDDGDSRLHDENMQAGSRVRYDDASDEPLNLLGLGPAARSSLPGRMGYLRLPGKHGISGTMARGRPMDERFEQARFAALHLPSAAGLDPAAYRRRFGTGPEERFGGDLDEAVRMGLLHSEAGSYRHTSDDPVQRYAVELALIDDGLIAAGWQQLEHEKQRTRGPAERALGVELRAGRHRIAIGLDGHRPGRKSYHHCGRWQCYVPLAEDGREQRLDSGQKALLAAFRLLFDRVVRVDRPPDLQALQSGLVARSGRQRIGAFDPPPAAGQRLELRPWSPDDA
jgi:oxygen-independent coproporphyrinogen-3 oxidase